jgi:hypothetical protein
MDYNLAIFSGLKNNSRRTLSNTKKHNFHNITRFPFYESEIEDEAAEAAEKVLEYDPSDYDTLIDVM